MAKTLQQEAFDVKHANEMEIAKRELMRRSHDTIRVYNPLSQTFSFMYDRFWHRIAAKSYKDMDRYLALKFFKNICDKMIGDMIGKKGAELKAERERQMGHQFTDHYEENVEVWDRTPKMNDPEQIALIKKLVIIGVVAEFGNEEVPMEDPIPEPQTDYRPLHEQMFDDLAPLSANSPLPASLDELQGKVLPVEEAPLYKSKATLAEEAKMDKKELEKEVLA